MVRRIEITRIVSVVALLGLGAQVARGVEPRLGEWRRVGPSFACVADTPTLMACLHMGPFIIGGDASTLEAALGAPYETVPQPKGAQALLWFLGEREQYPYFVATTLDGRIVALQVTGEIPAKGYGFNHVNLGDSTETLIKYFGAPFQVSKSDQPDTDLWAYPPWPFSFEVVAGRVTSIRIVDSAQ
jgi:hypothetical protein